MSDATSDFSDIPTAYPPATGFDSVYIGEVLTLSRNAVEPLEAVPLQQVEEMIGPAGPYVPLADVAANVLIYGADPTGVTDSAPAINAAIAAGRAVYMPTGSYLVRSALNVGAGTYLFGDGRGFTNILVDQTFSPTDQGVIVLTGVEDQAPIITDFRIIFAQPSTQGVRANFLTLAQGGTSGSGGTGIKYPPAIYANLSDRWKVERMRFDAAWDGIRSEGGQPGFINEIEMGALNCGLFIGGSRDFMHVSHYHFWPFGIHGNSPLFTGVWQDGDTYSAQLGTLIGINGLNAVDWTIFQGRLLINQVIGQTWIHFVNLMMDGGNCVMDMLGGQWVQISNLYFTGVSYGTDAGAAFINQSAGTLIITNLFAPTGTNPAIIQTGGVLRITGGEILNATPSLSSIVASGSADLDITSVTFGLNVSSGAWTVPVVSFTGTGRCYFQNNKFRDQSPGDVGGLVIANDSSQHVVSGNGWNGWQWVPPGVAGQYGFNGTIGNTQLHLNALTGRAMTANINADAGMQKAVNLQTAGLSRWVAASTAGAETGANAGSDFALTRYDDSGSLLGTPISIVRSTGIVTIPIGLTSTGTLTTQTLSVLGNSGFFGTSPISRQTVTGSKAGNAALASLLTALAAYGLITDSTT